MMRNREASIMSKKTTLVATVCGGLVAAAAFAHDTWLIPAQFNLAPKSTITLNITSGMEFPKLDVAPKAERVESVKCRLAGKTFDMTNKSAAPNSLQFKAELAEAGVATFWIKLPPKSIELKPAEVEHYLEEVSAPEGLRKQWTEMKPQRWRESYTKHPKTFARVGDPPSDQSWKEPVGMFLEIVPEQDPTRLRENEEFAVRVLKDGKPFPDFALNAVSEGETKGETRRTDSAGRVSFRLNKAGRLLFRGTDIRKSSAPETDYESDFATMTVEVGKN